MSDKDLFKQYQKLYRAYTKLLYAAKLAFKKLIRIQQESDSTKEIKGLLEAVESIKPEPPKEGPKPNGNPKPTETKNGSDS